jgi:hypothetical protein
MRILLILLSLSYPLSASEDLTHLIDTYFFGESVQYTNISDKFLRCMISTRVDPNLPLGTLAEKKTITVRPHFTVTHHRVGHKIIYCVEMPPNAAD